MLALSMLSMKMAFRSNEFFRRGSKSRIVLRPPETSNDPVLGSGDMTMVPPQNRTQILGLWPVFSIVEPRRSVSEINVINLVETPLLDDSRASVAQTLGGGRRGGRPVGDHGADQPENRRDCRGASHRHGDHAVLHRLGQRHGVRLADRPLQYGRAHRHAGDALCLLPLEPRFQEAWFDPFGASVGGRLLRVDIRAETAGPAVVGRRSAASGIHPSVHLSAEKNSGQQNREEEQTGCRRTPDAGTDRGVDHSGSHRERLAGRARVGRSFHRLSDHRVSTHSDHPLYI